MKRFITFTLAILIIFSLVACGTTPETEPTATYTPSPENTALPEKQSPPPTLATIPPVGPDDIEIALVTGSAGIEDKGIGENTYKGLLRFSEESGRSFSNYLPADESTGAYVSAITDAITNGARVVVVTGNQFGEALSLVAPEHQDVNFLGLDVADAGQYPESTKNLSLVTFREEESAYLAGYAAVMDGYSKLGFIGGVAIPSVIRFGYGFLQGADAAAESLDMDVDINYWYSGVFWPDDSVLNMANDWYSADTEIIFACGGNLNQSVIAAAEQTGRDIIGVGVDQSYLGDMFISSAYKDYEAAANVAMTDLYDNGREWPADYAGQHKSYGVKEGVVGLPIADGSWRFQLYSIADYEVLYNKILMGSIDVDDCGADELSPPELTRARVNFLNLYDSPAEPEATADTFS